MRWLSAWVIVAVLLGASFRFVNLTGKVYWHDEAYTGLYATGHNNGEVDALFDGTLRTVADVLPLQTATPALGLTETVRQLAKDDSQHPPLYYGLARLGLYGSSNTIFVTRLVAAVFGTLLIPAIYWLSWELFRSPLTASLSAALVAVSPFHYLYAQEAREYSLWALAIATSSAALLRALRQNSRLSWVTYGAVLTAGLYGSLLTLLAIISHTLYVGCQALVRYPPRWKASPLTAVRNFALSVGGALLLFTPWLNAIRANGKASDVSWTAVPAPLLTLARIWAGNVTRLFFDLNLDSNSPLAHTVVPVLISIGLVTYALLWSLRQMPRSALLFLALLGGVTVMAFAGPDIVFGGRRSSVSRYLIPAYLSLQIAIAYLLSQKISGRPVSTFWRGVTVGLLAVGILSCAVSLPADTWWNKKYSHLNLEVARIISLAPDSVLISSDYNINRGEILSLAHALNQDQPLLLFREPDLPVLPKNADTLFLFNLSKQTKTQLDQSPDYQVVPAYKAGKLWRLEPEKAR